MEDLNKILKVVIVEDSSLFRILLKKMLSRYNNIEICADFDNAEDTLTYIQNNVVNVVLLDTCLISMSGVEASNIIKKISPFTKVILFTSNNQDEELFASLSANVNAFLLKDISSDDLNNVINFVCRGGLWIDSRLQLQVFNLIRSLPEDDYLYFKQLLSFKEVKLINLVLKGFKPKEIGKYLNIGFCEIPGYVYSIFSKLAKTKKAEFSVRELKYDLL